MSIGRWSLMVFVVATVLVPIIVGPALAASTTTTATPPGYYNETETVDNETWMEGNRDPTVDNTTNFLTRTLTFFVGGGASPVGAVGALLTSLFVGGLALAMLGGSQVGVIGGVVAGSLTLGALAYAGLAPMWLWALVVGAIGLVVTAVVIRALR